MTTAVLNFIVERVFSEFCFQETLLHIVSIHASRLINGNRLTITGPLLGLVPTGDVIESGVGVAGSVRSLS